MTIYPTLDFEKGSCQEAGIEKNSLIDMFAKLVADEYNIHQLLLVKDGRKVFSAYQDGYTPSSRENIYSISKSFTSIAIGIAEDMGLLSTDDFVYPYFAKEVTSHLPGYENLRIRHLLTMQHGQEKDIFKDLQVTDDLFTAFFQVPLSHRPGEMFNYNNFSIFMLSAIISKTTGLKLNDFLDIHLYQPLAIPKPEWPELKGCNMGATALRLDAVSLAKFGHLLLNGGRWKDRQIVSKRYLDIATSKLVSTAHIGYYPDSHGYGYLFWINDFGDYRMTGMYQQQVVINKEFNFVFVIQGYESRDLLDLVRSYILPGFRKGWEYDSRSLRDSIREFQVASARLADAERNNRNY